MSDFTRTGDDIFFRGYAVARIKHDRAWPTLIDEAMQELFELVPPDAALEKRIEELIDELTLSENKYEDATERERAAVKQLNKLQFAMKDIETKARNAL